MLILSLPSQKNGRSAAHDSPVCQRVTIYNDQVGRFAALNGTEFVFQPHGLGAVNGGQAQSIGPGELPGFLSAFRFKLNMPISYLSAAGVRGGMPPLLAQAIRAPFSCNNREVAGIVDNVRGIIKVQGGAIQEAQRLHDTAGKPLMAAQYAFFLRLTLRLG